jgi:predicted RNA-binding protein (virulence factor B family)
MLKIGKMNRLQAIKQVDFGVYLDGGDLGNILLPSRYVPKDTNYMDEVDVFIYADSEDQLIATTETPKAMVGQTAYLKCIEVNDVGAFFDWGLPKDLLVPYSEQHVPMEAGKSYVLHLFLDGYAHRILASSRINRHLTDLNDDFEKGQEVDMLICGRSELGYKAVINHTHTGLIFKDDAFKPLKYGKQLKGFIKEIRSDNKIGLSLQRHAGEGRDELSEQILQHLRNNGGTSTLTDKSAPDDIYHHFNVSKKNYKKALGGLFKAKKILIARDKITLL